MGTRQDLGMTGYVAGLLALFTVILIGIEPAVPASDREPMLLAMSLFKQDPAPPAPKPKAALPKPPDPVGRVAPSGLPAVAAQPTTPGAVSSPAPGPAPVPAPAPGAAAAIPAVVSKPVGPVTPGAGPSGPGSVPSASVTAVPTVTPGGSPSLPGSVPGASTTAPAPVAIPGAPVPVGSVAAIDIPPGWMDGYTYDAKSRRDPFLSMVKLLKLSQIERGAAAAPKTRNQ